MSNVNTKTGIRFGVISGMTAFWLEGDIRQSGDDLSFQEFKDELSAKVSSALAGVVEDYTSSRIERLTDACDVDSIVESLLDAGLSDNYECDEPEYDYADSDGNSYHLSHLGGAAIIYCCQTKYVMRCRQCSPCVPGAGDLDNYDENGTPCYCPDPDSWGDEGTKFRFEQKPIRIGENDLIELIPIESDEESDNE